MTNETLMIVSLACSSAADPAYAYGMALLLRRYAPSEQTVAA